MKKIFTILCTVLFTGSTLFSFAGNRPTVIIPGQDLSKVPFTMNPKWKDGEDYMSKTIIFKVKSAYRQNCKTYSIDNIYAIQDFLTSIGAQNLAKKYPTHEAPVRDKNPLGQPMADISLIYSFKYTADMKLEKVINQMKSLGYFEYVEPWFIPKIDLVPNDTNYGNAGQYFCKGNVAGSIDAQNAWNIQTGSASVVIGIVDTGTEPTHPDLAANYLGGYDVAMNDADPTWQGNNHGCAVSGDACAVTNNSLGVASPSGIGCKFKAAKIADATGALIASYDGIVWAADNGCKIINCSWGGTGGGQYGQDIVNYAAINKNCLLCCSAGNGGVEESLWPSSYSNTYRVAASTNTDVMASFSSFGLDVDYSSPGNNIYSTINGTGYGSMSGTSMASPVSAGAAAIIQSQFNYTNAFQIGERMKQTCDPMTGVNYTAGKLGKGRIDLARAVTASVTAKSIVMNPITVSDGNDGAFMPNENLTISGTFINYLDPCSSSASATLSVVSGGTNVSITQATSTIGALATLGTNSSATPFTVNILPGAAINGAVKFKVTITDGTFTGAQYFDIIVNVDYINITINDVHTTITSKGRIGYNADGTKQGLGFIYQIPSPNNMLYEMSLMIGTSSTKVDDMFRETSAGNTDFAGTTRAYQVTPATVSDFDVDGTFNDAPSSTGALPVSVHHSAYAWSTAPYRRFVTVKYVIKNTGGAALSNLYAGIVADWDITNAAQNKSAYDAANKMGYCYDVSSASGLYAAIKLLTSGTANNYCLDNSATSGGVDPTTDFTTAEKYTVLSTARANDGFPGTGGDVMHCVSSGPFTINAGDSIVVAFALIGGDNLADIQNTACKAQQKWDNTGACAVGVNEVTADNFWADAYPNPASTNLHINYNFTGSSTASLKIMNTLGEVVMSYNDLAPGKNTLALDISSLSAGNYYYQMKAGDAVLTKKFSVIK